MLDLLNADPSESYKSLEKPIDDHDNEIRTLRRSSQHAIDDTALFVAARWSASFVLLAL
jgi:hypothetical protein